MACLCTTSQIRKTGTRPGFSYLVGLGGFEPQTSTMSRPIGRTPITVETCRHHLFLAGKPVPFLESFYLSKDNAACGYFVIPPLSVLNLSIG